MHRISLRKRFIFVLISLLLLGVFFVFGLYVGYHQRPEALKVTDVKNKESVVTTQADFSPYWKAWNIINQKYTNGSLSDPQEKVWGSIKGLVGTLDDPYSVFLAPEEAKMFEEDIQGSFSGIGIEVGMRDDVLTVVAPLKGSPASLAGVQAGDQILKIDDTVTANITLDEAVLLIRGEEGTPVVLTVLHDEASTPEEITIVRETIEIPTIETSLEANGSVFRIHLFSFTANAPVLFQEALQEYARSGAKDLIIDLRGNPGGYLAGSIDIASFFLPAGKEIVTESYSDQTKNHTYRSKGYDVLPQDTDVVVLIDGGSASASEIVAGALQEHNVATLVGTQTYGKGSVQELIQITADTALKLTVAKWLTPSGKSISEAGLQPDYEVAFDGEGDTDPQLNRALEILGY